MDHIEALCGGVQNFAALFWRAFVIRILISEGLNIRAPDFGKLPDNVLNPGGCPC